MSKVYANDNNQNVKLQVVLLIFDDLPLQNVNVQVDRLKRLRI